MTDKQILQWICAGGETNHNRALKAFYDRWAVQMKSFFVMKGLTPADAEDFFAEAVVKIWRNAGSYKGNDQARAWMWSIARNALTDQLRRYRSRAETELDEDLELTLSAADPAEHSAEDCVDEGLKRFEITDPERAECRIMERHGVK